MKLEKIKVRKPQIIEEINKFTQDNKISKDKISKIENCPKKELDIKDREELKKVITELKHNNIKFSIKRNLKENFRYSLEVINSKLKDNKIIY